MKRQQGKKRKSKGRQTRPAVATKQQTTKKVPKPPKVKLTVPQQIETLYQRIRDDMNEPKLSDSEITSIKERIGKLEEKLPKKE